MVKFAVKRRRNEDRRDLLAQLKQYQLQPDQLAQLHSTSSMQTKGLKKFANEPVKAEQCSVVHETATLMKHARRRRKQRTQATVSSYSSSSSEDTDDVSTDTELYYESSEDEKVAPIVPQATAVRKEPELIVCLNKKVPPASGEPKSEVPKLLKKSEPAIYVQVLRDPEIEKSRLQLPIINEEQNLMETIRYNDVVIVSGETGSGKTTQLPQFLYEAGYALNDKMIGITEPRRVAAVSMSERVARELNLSQDEVSYQIRFSGNVSNKTRIKFMTDGVLLRECQKDLLLSKYSVIIIDEAHERSVFSDILIGLLSRIVPMRAKRDDPLKLIIMSATLRVSDFTQNQFLFKQPPPTINIEARQFPVTVQFAKTTPRNHLQAAYKKVCWIHSSLPKGGILVFVTSQMDVKVLCRKLREKYPNKTTAKRKKLKHKETPKTRGKSELNNPDEDMQFNWSDVTSDSDDEHTGIIKTSNSPLTCLGLYAMLPIEKQRLVFREPKEGTRLCVIATNVAETSITIPNIRYVVDTGLEKSKVYDLVTGVSRFITTWTSKSSAEQRMGRAGRMGPGHCYRLYSSAVFTNDFQEYAQPHILQKPVEDVLLQMKAMNIDNVVNFPFPTRPSLEALIAAEKKLIQLEALDDSKCKLARYQDLKKTEFCSRLTKLGKAMSHFAVGVRCSKMIVLSPSHLLPYVISLVAALTVREMYLDVNANYSIRRRWASHGVRKLLGDYVVMLKAITLADSFECSDKKCIENGLRTKAMLEIYKLRKQLMHEVSNNQNYKITNDNISLKKPTDDQCNVLRQLLLSSYCDHVAKRIPDGYIEEKSISEPGKMVKKRLKNAYECKDHEGPVYISPESVLRGEHPDYIIYKELYQGPKKMYMRDVAVIEPSWLPQ